MRPREAQPTWRRRSDANSPKGVTAASRELMVMRLLSIDDPGRGAWGRRDLGACAQMGPRLLDGMDEGAARPAVKADWGLAAAVVFDRLLRALPAALQARDRHGVIAKLEQLGLRPLSAQNAEHMLCEFRKLTLPGNRLLRGEVFEGYCDLLGSHRCIVSARSA